MSHSIETGYFMHQAIRIEEGLQEGLLFHPSTFDNPKSLASAFLMCPDMPDFYAYLANLKAEGENFRIISICEAHERIGRIVHLNHIYNSSQDREIVIGKRLTERFFDDIDEAVSELERQKKRGKKYKKPRRRFGISFDALRVSRANNMAVSDVECTISGKSSYVEHKIGMLLKARRYYKEVIPPTTKLDLIVPANSTLVIPDGTFKIEDTNVTPRQIACCYPIAMSTDDLDRLIFDIVWSYTPEDGEAIVKINKKLTKIYPVIPERTGRFYTSPA